MNRMSASNPPLRTSRPEAEQIGALTTRLRVPGPVRVVKAPLRICPLGAHIDHQLGVVTGMTIDRAIFLAFVPASGGAVRVESLNFTPPVSFSLDDIPPPRRGDWGNYLRGAARALQGQHRLERGLTGVVGGDMPVGGLSSSAAVTIAYLLALEAANG
ncbi:MAG: galactokinase family protein, partial [Anaerolineae bacterium]